MTFSTSAVEARGVRKCYGNVLAVDGLNLAIPAGRIWGLVGPNGAGKTTVLGMLLGLVRPDAGELWLLGRRVGLAARTVDGVGGFLDTPAFYPYLSARKNLALLAGFDRGRGDADVSSVLHRVGLAEVADEPVRGFSLGMRQRLGIASALLRRLSLLVLDEPTNGLDPAGKLELQHIIRQLADSGVAVLLSSHHITGVEHLCDGVTIMAAGSVVFDGTLQVLREQAPEPESALRTSNDRAAMAVATAQGLRVRPAEGGGLVLAAEPEHLDEYVMRLVRSGIAVRLLQPRSSPLESLFFSLTEPQAVPVGSPRAEAIPAGVS